MKNTNKEEIQTVGIMGLGIMGSAMGINLVKAGFKVTGYDPLPAQRAALKKAGGTPVASVAAAARGAQMVITSLPSAAALAAVAQELAAKASKGLIVAETSTLPIPVKEAARKVLAKAGITMLDCPLSGTGAQARVKDLSVYASGPAGAVKKAAAVFAGFARPHAYVGEFGAGSKMKFIANLLVSIHNVSTAEAFVLGKKAGLDPQVVYDVIAEGAGGSRMFAVRGPMMVAGDYSDATMKVKTWQKDVQIIGDFLREVDCPAPLFNAAAPFYNAAMAMGLADADTAAVCEVLEQWVTPPAKKAAAKKPAAKPAKKSVRKTAKK
ncbi:MAG TPA: NAD(P)-dependent oxidoreductase [Burkholderiales bacterium]|jgi:3-hydroxyisobutyrate dehydrogenase-like beta-hydroxyacid dehydrogenase